MDIEFNGKYSHDYLRRAVGELLMKPTDLTKPLALSIEEVRKLTGLGRTKIYSLIGSGELIARKIGKRTVVLRTDLETWLGGLQPCPPKGTGQAKVPYRRKLGFSQQY